MTTRKDRRLVRTIRRLRRQRFGALLAAAAAFLVAVPAGAWAVSSAVTMFDGDSISLRSGDGCRIREDWDRDRDSRRTRDFVCTGGSTTTTGPDVEVPPSTTPPTTPPPSTPPPTSPPTGPAGDWVPKVGESWQYQLTGTIDTRVDAAVYDIDAFETPASVVDDLHAQGKHAICYISAGTWEDWRPDAGQFPDEVKGGSNGWPGESWLDIRRTDVLGPIMGARMDLCKAKGFDGVEPDNVDGYSNSTGFPLTAADQEAYNRLLATLAHDRGLKVGLKNDIEQAGTLVDAFDFAVNEECAAFSECEALEPFVAAGKPVFHVEYDVSTAEFCPTTNALGFSSIRKDLDLDASREVCA